MKLKVCGMKFPENIEIVAQLKPDYLGFIFYKKSPRHFKGKMPEISRDIKKVGVFVYSKLNKILNKALKYNLDAIQLHGEEDAAFCKKLKQALCDIQGEERIQNPVEIIKVFSVGYTFDFSVLEEFEEVCDYFLFDTKGKKKGGNGIAFDWKLLEKYPSKKPFFLSGGIGLEEIETLKDFFLKDISKWCYALDVNSKFEIKPGWKDVEKLQEFKNRIIQ
jgi:phosphoribosylanthranilate isomerase